MPPVRLPEPVRRLRMAPMSWPVSIVAQLCSSGMRRRPVEVVSISRIGCRALAGCRFTREEFVSLLLPTFGAMGARVVASDGNCAELRFEAKIGASTLELLLERHRRSGDVRF